MASLDPRETGHSPVVAHLRQSCVLIVGVLPGPAHLPGSRPFGSGSLLALTVRIGPGDPRS